MADAQFLSDRQSTTVSTNKVLRNTYLLLSMTLLFSAAMAGVAVATNAPYMGWLPLIISFGLLFAISKMRNSSWGIVLVFAFTGILGFSVGPIVNFYMQTAGGSQTVLTALSLTGVIFLSLSGYTLVTQKDFSFMENMLTVGIFSLFGFTIVGVFFPSTLLTLMISWFGVLLFSGYILYDTSLVLYRLGPDDAIHASLVLYLDIVNV